MPGRRCRPAKPAQRQDTIEQQTLCRGFSPPLLTASSRSGGKPAEGLPSYRASRPCAPPASHTPFPGEKRSTLHEPTQHAAMPDAPHSVGHRTALHSISQDNPAFAPPYFPIWNSASLVASKARPICRRSLRAKPGTTPLHPLRPVPRPQIPNSRLPQSPFSNSKFSVQISHPVHFLIPKS